MTKTATSGRPYERTHPWLTFSFDLRRLQHTDWLALGEAVSMIDRIAGTPLDPAVADDIDGLYLAKGVLATTAIEGNTLSEDEVRGLIGGSLTLPPSRQRLGQEVDNVVTACNVLLGELNERGRIPLTVERVKRMNGAVLRGLEVEDHVVPGRTRTANVTVGAYRCPEWGDAEYLLARLCGVLEDFDLPADGGHRHAFSILKAVFAHLHLVWVHPFGDGNGRTARLIEFAILAEAGLPQPACHLLSNHYNLTRPEYYRQLARAGGREDGIYGFAAYAIAGLVDGLREQVERIRVHQWDVAWVNFVHERFRDAGGATARRRRSLALSLSQVREEVGIGALPNLNATLAREYARVGARTLVRDVAALQRLGLLLRGQGGVRANRERILAFLPWRNEPEDETG